MTKEALIEKIEALPHEKKAEVEKFVEGLHRDETAAEPAPTRDPSSDPLLERVRARRERLLREHGLFDTSDILRELREEGG